MPERAGVIEIVDETKQIEWRISDIFAKGFFLYESPIFSSTWKLLLGQSSDGMIAIAIWSSAKREYSLRYSFGLKNSDGSTEKKISGILEGDKVCCLWSSLIEKDELLQQKTELAPSDILTVTCTLKRTIEISDSLEPEKLRRKTVVNETKSLKSTGLLALLHFELEMSPIPLHIAEKTGEVATVYEAKLIEWRISDIFGKDYFMYESPIFSTTDHSWNLLLRQSSNGIIAIAVWTNVKRNYLLRYCFGLKRCDGSGEKKVSGILEGDKSCCLWSYFINKEELFQRKAELAPSNVLTVTCTLKRTTEISHSAEPPALDKSKSLKLTNKL